jgi:hypothetical protein
MGYSAVRSMEIQYGYIPIAELVVNPYSLPPEAAISSGGFQYENCPEIFSVTRGCGPLRMAWDTNIFIDYTEFGDLIWESTDFDPQVTGDRYRDQLIALSEIMQLWTLRDIRIRMPSRQINDTRRRLDDKAWELRRWQLEHFQSALSCVSLDTEIDNSVAAFEALPDGSSNDDWDRSLVEEAIATGCHIFLTGDRRLRKRHDRMARNSHIIILPPTELLDCLASAGELSFSNIGQEIMPDTHKFVHVMNAHKIGYASS